MLLFVLILCALEGLSNYLRQTYPALSCYPYRRLVPFIR
jgi:hypothetical protein